MRQDVPNGGAESHLPFLPDEGGKSRRTNGGKVKIKISFVKHEYSHAVLEIPDDLVEVVSRENIEDQMWVFAELAERDDVQWTDDEGEVSGEVWDVELDPVGVDADPVYTIDLDTLGSLGFTTEAI